MSIASVAAPRMRTRQFLKQAGRELRSLFVRPPRMQFGALCYRPKKNDGPGAIEVLLITSRESRRWVIPKGWPMEGRSAAMVAAREAYEEAGVRGRTSEEPVGQFAYGKKLRGGLTVRCLVQVHALQVAGIEADFPECHERTLCWLAPDEAAKRVAEPGLRRLLASFAPKADAARR